jgi:hypothetical protein
MTGANHQWIRMGMERESTTNYYPPRPTLTSPTGSHTVRNIFLIALGVVLGITVIAAIFAAGGDSYSDSYSDSGYSERGSSGGGSGESSQHYDDGTLTKTDDGTIIVSGNDGTSLSTG